MTYLLILRYATWKILALFVFGKSLQSNVCFDSLVDADFSKCVRLMPKSLASVKMMSATV